MAVRYTTARYSAGIETAGTAPSARWGHTAVRFDDCLIIYGGRSAEAEVLADCHIFNFGTRLWSRVESPNSETPPARWGHAAVIYKEAMYVMGGENASGNCTNDTWRLNLETCQWAKVSAIFSPTPRKLHKAVVFDDSIYIVGGIDSSGKSLNDVWFYESAASIWLEVRTQGDLPRRGAHTAVVYKNSLFIYGGRDGDKDYDDLWELKLYLGGADWQKVVLSEPASPTARSGHTCVVLRDAMYMLGGGHDDDANAVYEFSFDYRKWCKIITTGDPVSRLAHHTMSVRGEAFFVFGGHDHEGAGSGRLDYLCLGKDEFLSEETTLDDEYKKYPRAEWEGIVLRRHPEILELRERVRPLTGLPSFSRMARSSRTENRNALSHRVMLQLVMEHLDNEQHSKTVQAIQKESNLLYVKPPEAAKAKESQLVTLLRLSQIRLRSHYLTTKDIFAPDLPKPYDDEFDKEVEVIDHLPGRAKEEEQADVNVWDEPPDSPEKNIVKELNKNQKLEIQAGTLNKLIEQLVPDADKPLDLAYIKIFVHTHQSFTTPQVFLKKLVQRYQVPVPKGMSREEYKSKVQQPMAKRVCNVIKYWVEKGWGDFLDSRLLYQLNGFIDGCLARDGYHQLAHSLRAAINKNKLSHHMDEKMFVSEPPEPKVPVKIFSTKLTTKQIDDEEIARQLTLMHFELYQAIQPSEFLNKSWLDPHLRFKAPNVIAMMKAYEEVSLWVATEILTQDKARRRVKLIKKFIDIAKYLRQLNNFHSLFAVLAGLNLPPVQSLNRAFSEIPLQTQSVFSDLVKLIPPREGEALAYKESLQKSVDEGHLPLLPYLDVVLRDILLIEDGIPSRTKVHNLINFEKRARLFSVIQKVHEHQRRVYNLQPVHQVRVILEESINAHKPLKELEAIASRLDS